MKALVAPLSVGERALDFKRLARLGVQVHCWACTLMPSRITAVMQTRVRLLTTVREELPLSMPRLHATSDKSLARFH